MERLRKPWQGVTNIVRFNWPFYVLSVVAVAVLLVLSQFVSDLYAVLLVVAACGIVFVTVVSLGVSAYVYDVSDLYTLNWLPAGLVPPNASLLNINAGFDETSDLLQHRYPDAQLTVLDFYDPAKHTEISIQRARLAYPPYPGTQPVRTTALPASAASVDVSFLIFAAHEIRDDTERAAFFRELHRLTEPDGRVVVTEHLRNGPNFLAYTIGFLHFHSRATWHRTFATAGFVIDSRRLVTPFVTTFILRKDDFTA